MAIGDRFIGKKCIVRSRDQGVVYGTVLEIDGRSAVVDKPVQLWRWASSFVLIELASYGPSSGEQRYSRPGVEPLLMTETCGILICHEQAAKMIEAVKAQEFA